MTKKLPPLKPGEIPRGTPFAPDGSLTIDDRAPVPPRGHEFPETLLTSPQQETTQDHQMSPDATDSP